MVTPALQPPILHVSTARGWRGGERQVLLLATGLRESAALRQAGDVKDRQDGGIVVAAPRNSPLAQRAAAAGAPVLPLPSASLLHPGNLLRLMVHLRRRPSSIVHSHTSPALSIVAILRRWAPLAATVHTRRVAFPVRPSSKYRRAADHYVAISQAVATRLREAGLARDRLSVIPSAVELAPLDSAAGCPQPRQGGPVVVCVGQLTPEKGHAVLLDAWKLVLVSLPEARLVLLGDGPEETRLRRAAATLPEGAVDFVGFRNDVPTWLRRCDLVVQPSLSEGLGTSVLDAMGCRLAVVASNTGGLAEVVEHGTTGLLVPPGDPQALAAGALRLLSDDGRRAAMGRAGRHRVERYYSIGTMVERHLDLYQELACKS